jgi:hypothetical protein
VEAIPDAASPGLVLMHDWHQGLKNAQANVMPDSFSSNCVFHLEMNLNHNFRSNFDRKIWAAAKATTTYDYERAMEAIGVMNPEAKRYLERADPSTWATAKLPAARFGCITSNLVESFNSWLLPLRQGSHLNVVVSWVSYWASVFYKQNQHYSSMHEVLPTKA